MKLVKRIKEGLAYMTEAGQYAILNDTHGVRGYHLGVQESISLRQCLSYKKPVPKKTVVFVMTRVKDVLVEGNHLTPSESLELMRYYISTIPFYRDTKTDEPWIDFEALLVHATWKSVKVLVLAIIDVELKLGDDFNGSDKSILLEINKLLRKLESRDV